MADMWQGVNCRLEAKSAESDPGACLNSSMIISSVPVQTALLAGAIRITGSRVVRVVRPFALSFPPTVIGERDQGNIGGLGALGAILYPFRGWRLGSRGI